MSRTRTLWVCDECDDAISAVGGSTDAHCAGSVTLGTSHERTPMRRVEVVEARPAGVLSVASPLTTAQRAELEARWRALVDAHGGTYEVLPPAAERLPISPAVAVRAFHERFGLVVRDELQVDGIPADERRRVLKLLVEEFAEYVCAMTGWDTAAARRLGDQIMGLIAPLDGGAWPADVAAVARESSDLLAMVYGIALNWGYDQDAAFAEVMRTCMLKVRGDDPAKPVVKPEGWVPPDVAKAIGLEA